MCLSWCCFPDLDDRGDHFSTPATRRVMMMVVMIMMMVIMMIIVMT